ncbi:unnamed protein product, partial [Haemonchus placei]|uniref:Abhydrolase_9 domain-containing protein n=1 Tax=Haemonchus placei TaxID=6290 RepID=A0A0N4WMR2_HAEPC
RGSGACSPADKATVFADHFSKSFTSDDFSVPEFPSSVIYTMNEVPWFYGDQLYERIMRWPRSTSVTPDFIPLVFIQNIADVIVEPLAYIFNQSLMSGEVSQRWKHSFITPVLKKEPSSDPANYRPVSITSLFCRLFEKNYQGAYSQVCCRSWNHTASPTWIYPREVGRDKFD